MDIFIDDWIKEETPKKYIEPEISIKCPNSSLDYINKCYNYLRVLGLCNSSCQFSSNFLHKSKDYYACLKTLESNGSLATIHTLIHSLELIAYDAKTTPNKQRKLTYLINMGYRLLFQKYMTGM